MVPREVPEWAFAIVFGFDDRPYSFNDKDAARRVVKGWCEYWEVDAQEALRAARRTLSRA